MPNTQQWLKYWSGDVSLYVSPGHLEAHYRLLFARIRPLLPPPPFCLLDFGCGEALMAHDLAELGGRVVLFDQAPNRHQILRQLHGENPRILIPDTLKVVEGNCDMALMISVIQYISKPALPAVLEEIRLCLKPGGRLLVGDILVPDSGLLADVWALLCFGWREGFLVDALKGLARTLCSPYRRERQRLGLTAYRSEEIRAVLEQAGFTVQALEQNIGHAGNRYSLMATRC